MARKLKKQGKTSCVEEISKNILPQNIFLVGERVEWNKNIYISQPVYKEIHKFTQKKTVNESGGILIGNVIEDFGKTNIIINGFIEAKFCEATPTTLKFTHETWEFVHKEIDKKHKGKKIVGWIHTHPDFGIFLSEYDVFVHQNFFNEAYQVAYVVDPIQNIEGFCLWNDNKIEKCKGFYIYDKVGTQITVAPEKKPSAQPEKATSFNTRNVLIAFLFIAVLFLTFANISTNNKLQKIEMQQQTLVSGANQTLASMYQIILEQAEKIQKLEEALTNAGIVVAQESTDDSISHESGAEETISGTTSEIQQDSNETVEANDNEFGSMAEGGGIVDE